MLRLFSLVLVTTVLFSCSRAFPVAYKIKVTIEGLSETKIQLGYYFEDKQYIYEETTSNKHGQATFKGEEALPGGLYMIIVPEKWYFDILITDDQQFSFKTDTISLAKGVEITGSGENTAFYEYQRYIAERQNRIAELAEMQKDSTGKDAGNAEQKIEAIRKEMQTHWKATAEANKGTFLATMLTAMNGEPPEGYSMTSFFPHIDFADDKLLRTPVIHRAVKMILARNLNHNMPVEYFIKELDLLIEKASANNEVYKYVLNYLLDFFGSFQRAGMNEIFTYIAEEYYLSGKALWVEAKGIEIIKNRRDVFKGCMVGSIAPDIEMLTPGEEYISLHQLNAKYTLLFFWSTGCGHCESATRSIKEFYQQGIKDIEVFSVYTKNSKKEWEEFIKKNEIANWINCYDPENESEYKFRYYVVSTPLLYLLDSDKRIIAKQFGDTQIAELINRLQQQEYESGE